MTFTILVTAGTCNHIAFEYTTSTGKIGKRAFTRDELVAEVNEIDAETKAMIVLTSFIKKQRSIGRTWPQVKTDVEAEIFYI